MRKKVLISGLIPQVALEMLSKEFAVTMHEQLRLLTKKEFLLNCNSKLN